MDSDTPQNLKTLEINRAHDEMHNPFRPHIAAMTNISVVDGYSPLLDRDMTVTSVTPHQTLKPWIFWRSGDVLSVKCPPPPPPSSRPPPNYTLIQKSILPRPGVGADDGHTTWRYLFAGADGRQWHAVRHKHRHRERYCGSRSWGPSSSSSSQRGLATVTVSGLGI